jgi:alpha-beta hydrolase superfamily lysophospholipase
MHRGAEALCEALATTGELRASFPFLIVHSVGDPVPIAPCHTLMRAAATPDKELLELDGASHQILSDPAWEEPLDHAIRWIQQRIDELPQPPVVANQ